MITSGISLIFVCCFSIALAVPKLQPAPISQRNEWAISETNPSASAIATSDKALPLPSNPLPLASIPLSFNALSAPNTWSSIPLTASNPVVPAPLPAPVPAPPCGKVTVTSIPVSQSNQNGETIIHRPSPIIVKRPPTKIQINHPPIVVRPSPVVFHKPPAKISRPTIVKTLPPQVQVEPVLMKVLKPTQRKVIVSQPPCDNYNIPAIPEIPVPQPAPCT